MLHRPHEQFRQRWYIYPFILIGILSTNANAARTPQPVNFPSVPSPIAEQLRFEIPESAGRVTAVAISNDGEILFSGHAGSGSGQPTIRIWDFNASRQQSIPLPANAGIAEQIVPLANTGKAIVRTENGALFRAALNAPTVASFDVPGVDAPISDLAANRNGRKLGLVNARGIFTATAGGENARLLLAASSRSDSFAPACGEGSTSCLAFASQGRILFAATARACASDGSRTRQDGRRTEAARNARGCLYGFDLRARSANVETRPLPIVTRQLAPGRSGNILYFRNRMNRLYYMVVPEKGAALQQVRGGEDIAYFNVDRSRTRATTSASPKVVAVRKGSSDILLWRHGVEDGRQPQHVEPARAERGRKPIVDMEMEEVEPGMVLFDFGVTPETDRFWIIDNRRGFIHLNEFPEEDKHGHVPGLHPSLSLLPTRNGWVAIDRQQRYAGDEAGPREISVVLERGNQRRLGQLELGNFAQERLEPELMYLVKSNRPEAEYETAPPELSTNVFKGIPRKVDVKVDLPLDPDSALVTVWALVAKDDINGDPLDTDKALILRLRHQGNVLFKQIRLPGTGEECESVTLESGENTEFQGEFLKCEFELAPLNGTNVVRAEVVKQKAPSVRSDRRRFPARVQTPSRLFMYLVWVNDYDPDELTALESPQKDAQALLNAMRQEKRLFSDVVGSSLANGQVQRRTFHREFKKFVRNQSLKRQDVLWVHITGHGYHYKENPKAKKSGDFYILPTSAKVRVRDYLDETDDAIAIADIEHILREAPSANIILTIDTCAAGKVTDDFSRRKFFLLGDSVGLHILAVTQQNENAYAVHGQNGVGARALLEALEGRAAAADRNKDGELLVGELFDYAKVRIPRLAKELGGGSTVHRSQHPATFTVGLDMPIRRF